MGGTGYWVLALTPPFCASGWGAHPNAQARRLIRRAARVEGAREKRERVENVSEELGIIPYIYT